MLVNKGNKSLNLLYPFLRHQQNKTSSQFHETEHVNLSVHSLTVSVPTANPTFKLSILPQLASNTTTFLMYYNLQNQ